MKPSAFDYVRPRSLEHAVELLGQGEGNAKLLAGGQTLGPMLNLRVVQPELLVDIGKLPETTRWSEDGDGVVIGACVTHAAIEDSKVPDPTGGMLRRVASGIAYRAVRNRGTIGGSLAHADPAADWLSSLSALGAEAVILGAAGERRVPVAALSVGIFETVIGESEVLRGIRVRRLSPPARWGYYKFCRKAGEFAEAMSAVLYDPERGFRLVIGAVDGAPIILDGDAMGIATGAALPTRLDDAILLRALAARGLADDPYKRQVHLVAAQRAFAQARAA
jgi:aerobic carbon-monoxide dehydrogenase medium subunit